MISARTGVHLPDTTYGGTPIDWNCADNLKNELQQLRADNAKLRELTKRMHCQIKQTCGGCDGYYCSNFDEDNECCVYDTLLRELGVEVSND